MPDLDRLYGALDDKTLNATCVYCGHNEWKTGNEYFARIVAVRDPAEPVTNTGWIALPLFCGHCGFIRFHAVPQLEE